MSARHALLGLLHERSGYPYQLADRLCVRFGRAWQINSGQLSRTIDDLKADGLIERVGGTPDEGVEDRRHIYAITDAGETEWEDWSGKAPKIGRILRRPLILKISFTGPDNAGDTLADISVCEYECVERVTELSREPDQEPPEHWSWFDRTVFRLSLNADIAQVEAELKFLREARAELSVMARAAAMPNRPKETPQKRRERDDVLGHLASGHLRLACGGKQDDL